MRSVLCGLAFVPASLTVPSTSLRAIDGGYPHLHLFSFGYRVAFVDPIGAEVVVDVEGLHVGEAHGVEGVVGRLHVGAVGPGAASAVDDDEFVARQGFEAGAETLKRGCIRGRAEDRK